MKKYVLPWCFVLLQSFSLFAQEDKTESEIESLIRHLETVETQAVVKQDVATLKKLWAEDFMVNNPYNTVVKGRAQVLERMSDGVIHYASFEREIESMMVMDNLVIVMGLETIAPIGDAPMAGETVKRRYTNLWKLEDGEWRVKARHANIICER
jgi:ketosteroid isomerase-like protein